MRHNNVDFENRELRTNILNLLLLTTRRGTPDDTRVLRHCDSPDNEAELQRHQEQTAIAPLKQSNILARLLVTTRRITQDDTQQHQEQPL